MQFGRIIDTNEYEELVVDKIWQEVFSWLHTVSTDTKNGIHEIRGHDIYANVMFEPTIARLNNVFEVHRQYIDLHFCVDGGEIIEYADPQKLVSKNEYDAEKDAQLFLMNENPEWAQKMVAGDFAIFYPGEAHAPKIQDGENDQIKKVVVKIKQSLLHIEK